MVASIVYNVKASCLCDVGTMTFKVSYRALRVIASPDVVIYISVPRMNGVVVVLCDDSCLVDRVVICQHTAHLHNLSPLFKTRLPPSLNMRTHETNSHVGHMAAERACPAPLKKGKMLYRTCKNGRDLPTAIDSMILDVPGLVD